MPSVNSLLAVVVGGHLLLWCSNLGARCPSPIKFLHSIRESSTLLLSRLRALLLLALVSLSLSAVPLAQAQHRCLAHIGVAGKEAFQVVRLHDCRNLDMALVLHAVF